MDFIDHRSGAIFQFKVQSTERTRVTSDGDWVVGSTTAFGTSGATLGANGRIHANNNITVGASASYDLGESSAKFRNLYLSGDANTATLTTSGNATIGGNATITGDLTVNGTTTTINTATLDVEDKNITLNYGTGDTSSTADGAGITIQDAVDASNDATILWDASGDKFVFSHAIDVTGTITADNNLTIQNSSAYGSIELGGVSGGFIDIKRPFSDDYDLRLIAEGDGGVINVASGELTIQRAGSAKLATTSTGIDVTGTITTDGAVSTGAITVDHTDGTDNISLTPTSTGGVINVRNSSGTSVIALDGRDSQVGINVTGEITSGNITSTGNLTLSDVGVAYFGTGLDLRIFHDGSNSYINGAGTGSLQLQTGGSTKLEVLSTGIDVTGSITADGLTSAGDVAITGGSSGSTVLTLTTNALTDTPLMVFQRTGGAVAGKLAYDDTNTAMSFGTTTAHELRFLTNNTEQMQLTSAGFLGLGTSSPEKRLHIFDSTQTNQTIRFGNPSATPLADINYNSAGYEHLYISVKGTTTGYGNIVFSTGPTPSEAMRLDASGTLLVGKTATGIGTAGIELTHDNVILGTRNGGTTQYLNRLSSDGDIIAFMKDGTTVGSIGVVGSDILYIGTADGSDAGLNFDGDNSRINPCDGTGAATDNALDLGQSGARFKDLYLSSGIKTNNNAIDINSGSSNTVATFTSTDTEARIDLVDTTGSAQIRARNDLRFYVNGGSTRAVDINTSGYLLVGKTSGGIANVGVEARGNGLLFATTNQHESLQLNRLNSDGTILILKKDGAVIGDFGSTSGSMYIQGYAATGKVGLTFYGSSIEPRDSGAAADNAVDLGATGTRFKDLWLSGSVNANYINSGSDTNTFINFAGSDIIRFGNGGSESARLDASGNLLLGKTSADNTTQGIRFLGSSGFMSVVRSNNTLAIFNRIDSDGTLIEFRRSGTTVGSVASVGGSDTKFVFSSDGDQYITGNSASNYLTFSTANSERMRVNSSGELLINCTALPTGSAGGFGFTSDQLFTATTSTTANYQIRLYNGNGLVGSIVTDGSSTAFNTSSDERLKDNIVDAPSASDDIDAIKVRSFDWKADGSHQKYGMIAQELGTVAPEAVSVPDDAEEMQSVDYSKLVPMLVKEIQSLRARVAQLEGEN